MPRRTATLLLLTLPLLALLNACGSDDAPTAPPATEPQFAPDTSPPASPVGLVTRNLALQRVKVAWQANVTDPDVVGYRLTRTGRERTVVLVDAPADITHFVDDHPFGGLALYAVTAVDAAGNESPAATIIHDPESRTPDLVRR